MSDEKLKNQISSLPSELLLVVAKNLQGDALVSFGLTCKRFADVCRALRLAFSEIIACQFLFSFFMFLFFRAINLEYSERRGFSLGFPVADLALFFKIGIQPQILTECNFNNCYWIPASTLQNFLIKCPNLRALHVAETSLTVEHMMKHIFPKCQKITSLSLTLSRGDFWISKETVSRNKQDRAVFDQSCAEMLKNLTSLELVVKSATKNMLDFLW